MTREEMREGVAAEISRWVSDDMPDCRKAADAAIAIIRAETLEEAAKVALDEKRYGTMSVSESLVRFSVSAAIRALKDKP